MKPQIQMSALFDHAGRTTHHGVRAAFAGVTAAVIVSYFFIDRPVADYAHAVLRPNVAFYAALTHIVDPVPVFAGLVTGGYTIAALAGIEPGPRGRMALRIAIAILVAIALKEQIKFLAGRTWPETWTQNNPSYIKDGVYGFFPMQGWWAPGGGRGYHAFPSGHLTTITVAAVSVALNWPRLAWAAVLPVVLVAIGMIGANYHWVSDLIAGAALGLAVAIAAHRIGIATRN